MTVAHNTVVDEVKRKEYSNNISNVLKNKIVNYMRITYTM